MEQKAPGIYISEPLTEARGLDFDIKYKRTLENTVGPCGEQGTRTPLTPTSTGILTFLFGLIENNLLSMEEIHFSIDRGGTFTDVFFTYTSNIPGDTNIYHLLNDGCLN